MTDVDAPKTDLIRMVQGEIRATSEGRTLAGYAAVFNEPTEIHSYEGHFIERIAPGAFKKTIRENRDKIKVLFNHGMDPQIGDKPLGKPTVMKEDKRGLWVEVPLSRTSYNEDIMALLADGALDGMSFRFSVPEGKEDWNYPRKGLPERTIREVRMPEFGPVTFPAYDATTAGVRSLQEMELWSAASPEQRDQIRDVLKLSDVRAEDIIDLGTTSAVAATETQPSEPDSLHSLGMPSTAAERRAKALHVQAILQGVFNEQV